MHQPGARRGQPEAADTSAEEGTTAPRIRLGDWLRAARLRRGFSLAEAEHDTRINRVYLEALEDEHFDVLPAPVYTRGFLRSYARLLGLDAEQAVALLPEHLPIPPGLEPSAALRRPGRESPAIPLPRLPSMRVPSLRIPELRTPGAMSGLRLPTRVKTARPASTGSEPGPGLRLALPQLPAGPEARRWGAAVVGVLLLLVAAVIVPRALQSHSATPAARATATVAAVQATTVATVQAAATVAAPGGVAATAPAANGPKIVNYVGTQVADTQKALQDAGLTWVVVDISSPTAPQGQVVGQQPTAGTVVNKGDNVTLIVSRGAPKN